MENESLIMKKLDAIELKIDSIEEHIGDVILTADDLDSIQEARKDLKEGRTTSHEQLKKELIL